jgi:hypothetical protein
MVGSASDLLLLLRGPLAQWLRRKKGYALIPILDDRLWHGLLLKFRNLDFEPTCAFLDQDNSINGDFSMWV